MRKPAKKTRAQKGETLIETLVSIMVISLSSVILLGAINAAARINRQVGEMDTSYRTDRAVAESGGGSLEGEVSVKVKGSNAAYQYKVLFAGEVGDLRSYDKVVTPP